MKFFDLFAGIGGFRLGLERCGHKCISSCEIDRYCVGVYNHNFRESNRPNDVRKLDATSLPEFDILTAGFPCQSFSVAGQRLGFNDTRGTLFFEIARIAREKRPSILFLENVKGLLGHDNGKTFGTILNTLYDLGYDVEWQVINGKYFVPQSRERVFIIGHLREKPTAPVFPITDGYQVDDSTLSQTQTDGSRIRSPYTRTIDYNYWKGGGSRTMILMSHSKANIKKRIQDRDSTWSLDTSGDLMAIVDCGSSRDRVYDKNGLSPSLVTPAGGRAQPKIIEHEKIRKLTPLECERLMGFPDNWTKVGDISDTQRYKMLGNSVIPGIIEFIGKKIK